MARLALNGCGRIGKNIVRILLERKREHELIAINIGPGDPDMIAYALQYDSILGHYSGDISYHNRILRLNQHAVEIFTESSAKNLPWKRLNVDWAIDASGHYRSRERAQEHIVSGAHSVLITAPMEDEDVTIIMGVNDRSYNPLEHTIISLGSCTTNAVAPLLAACKKHVSFQSISMTTAHSYTNSQSLLDGVPSAKDPRRGRAAACNIVPSTTGALRVVQKIMPDLANNIIGHALRVPIPNGSIIDLVIAPDREVTRDQLIGWLQEYAMAYPHIMRLTDVPLVSSDIMRTTHSVIVDLELLSATPVLCKVFGWYDNEYGYSSRVCDFLETVTSF